MLRWIRCMSEDTVLTNRKNHVITFILLILFINFFEFFAQILFHAPLNGLTLSLTLWQLTAVSGCRVTDCERDKRGPSLPEPARARARRRDFCAIKIPPRRGGGSEKSLRRDKSLHLASLRCVPLVKPFVLILAAEARGAVVKWAGVREKQI